MKAKNLLNNYAEILQKADSSKVLLGIIFFTILVFSPVFTNSEFLSYDDDWYIYENSNVVNFSWQSITNIFTSTKIGQYSPFGEFYHSFLYYLFGKNATAFKVCALLVHLMNITLLFIIFKNLFKNRLFVLIVILLFAIHPMQVETIGWLSAIYRNAVFFMLLGYYFYLKYLENNFHEYRLIPVLICYILAFLTKEQAVLFPVGLFLIRMMKIDVVWNRKFVLEMIFWSFITLVFIFVTIEVTKTGGPNIEGRNIPFFEKLVLLTKMISKYCYNFLFPHQLSFSYTFSTISNELKSFNISLLTSLLVLVFGGYTSFKNKINRFGFLWVLGFLSLALAMSFLGLRKTFMADRYAYLAIVGFSVLFCQVLFYMKAKLKFINKISFLVIVIGVISSFSIVTFQRVSVFKNDKNLWIQVLKVDPNNYLAYSILGIQQIKYGKLDSAKTLFKNSVRLNPNYHAAYNNLASVYYDQKKFDSALVSVSKAIEIKPNYLSAYENRAVIYSVLGKKDLYLRDLNKLIEISPNKEKFFMNRSKLYFKEKKYKESLKDALELVKNPNANNEEVFYFVGHNYLILRKYKEADIFLSKAIHVKPEKSRNYYWRSVARVSLNKWADALKDALQAKKLGFKVNNDYLILLAGEVKKRNSQN